MSPIPPEYYQSLDVIKISQDLLGKLIVTEFNGKRSSGIIVETEAYKGPEDKASHAYNNRRTKRTETMFAQGGVVYMYLCYGIHHLLNIVTGPKDTPHAVLIRAIEPIDGIELMLKRRKLDTLKRNLTAGPGLVSQALGLTTKHDGLPLSASPIWLEDHLRVPKKDIIASPRVGVGYAKEHANLPWRFRIKDNPWTSPAK